MKSTTAHSASSGVDTTLDVALYFRFDQGMDIDIRPLNLDRLVQLNEAALASRKARIDALLVEFEERCAVLKEELDARENITRFLRKEQAAAILADRLQREEIVRVKCPKCQGSGMKPTDTTGGQLHKKSAFESVGQTVSPTKKEEIAPADRCTECDGKKWVLMERFRG
jgi:hypothetical protein